MPLQDAIVGQFRLVIEVSLVPHLPGDTYEAIIRSTTKYVRGEPRTTVSVRGFRLAWGRTAHEAVSRLLAEFSELHQPEAGSG